MNSSLQSQSPVSNSTHYAYWTEIDATPDDQTSLSPHTEFLLLKRKDAVKVFKKLNIGTSSQWIFRPRSTNYGRSSLRRQKKTIVAQILRYFKIIIIEML